MKLELKNKENIRIGQAKDKGLTYFAKKNFKKGEVVLYISGSIIFKPTDYTIPIGAGLFIDPTDFGGKYLNDYPEPNLGIKNRTQLIAIRNIKKGEEIGIGYFMIVPFYIKNSNASNLNLSYFLALSKKKRGKYKKYISDYLFDKKEVEKYKKNSL